MNNDFIFKPKNAASSNSSSSADKLEDTSLASGNVPAPEELSKDEQDTSGANVASQPLSDDTATEAAEPPQSSVVTSNKPAKSHSFLIFLIMLLLLVAAAGGVYYWQHQKVQGLQVSKNNLSAQVTSLQAQLNKSNQSASDMNNSMAMPGSAALATATDIITGAPTKVTATEADVVVEYSMKGMPTEVWVESGTQPNALTTVSAHQKTSSEGMPGSTYGSEGFAITGLKANTLYFYRGAGLIDGKTVYGGIVAVWPSTTK